MLIVKDLTKSSRRQSLQVEKCTSNDPQPMMAVDGRGEDGNDGNDGNWWTWRSRCLLTKGHHLATLIVEELIKHCQSKEELFEKIIKTIFVVCWEEGSINIFSRRLTFFGHNLSKNSALGQQKICKRTNHNWSWSIFCSPRQHLVFAQKRHFS